LHLTAAALRLFKIAEVGLVAHSVAQIPEFRSIAVEPGLYEPILQGLGIIVGSRHDEEARRFTSFLLSDPTQKQLAAFGFGTPAVSGNE
jgi:ABC-type molybdate transport system substrate-binding protein